MAEPRKLSKLGLVIWLSLPFAIVAAMLVWQFGIRDRPNPEFYQQRQQEQKHPSVLPDPMP
ncbi:MAG: hypothetical protein H7210_06295 [Pyrinomonadaceae bacterium]|nr:hypothetical protein [Phycisphaerales bacterium]